MVVTSVTSFPLDAGKTAVPYLQERRKRILSFLFVCAGPPLILIDHGHFQYNGVSLALGLITVVLCEQGRVARRVVDLPCLQEATCGFRRLVSRRSHLLSGSELQAHVSVLGSSYLRIHAHSCMLGTRLMVLTSK